MTPKTFPFSFEEVQSLARQTPTPFYIYDGAGILRQHKALTDAFAWCPDFRNYFAVKATPNPAILELLHTVGSGVDCSSMAELVLAERAGFRGEEIFFTSNDTPAEEFRKAAKLGAILNFDDITHIEFAKQAIGRLPELACCRLNPGKLKEGNAIIGKPEEAKYGFTPAQLFDGYRLLKENGVKRFGLHTMVASNERKAEYFVETARIVFELVAEISEKVGIEFEFVDLGGGIGIPYRPEDDGVDLSIVGNGIREAMDEMLVKRGFRAPRICFECGRFITGPCGYLVSRVLHVKDTWKKYIGMDACMANLMRPALYGAYHHITVLGKENESCTECCDVTGSLCENNDKFAIDRLLPKLERGDWLVFHDAGAHGHAMGFNYNGKLRSAEWLVLPNGKPSLIRRAETLDNLFATLVPPVRVRPEPKPGTTH